MHPDLVAMTRPPVTRTYGAGRTHLGSDGGVVQAGGALLGVIPRSTSPLPLSSLATMAPVGRPRLRSIDPWAGLPEPLNRQTAAARRAPAPVDRMRRPGEVPLAQQQAQQQQQQRAPSRRFSRVGRSRRRETQSPASAEEPASRDPLAHPDLMHMRNTLMHIADAGEIPPAEFWMSAGLTPIIAQGGELSGIRLLDETMESD
jgi:hypothetical protein